MTVAVEADGARHLWLPAPLVGETINDQGAAMACLDKPIHEQAPSSIRQAADCVEDPEQRERMCGVIDTAWLRHSGQKIVSVVENACKADDCADDAERVAAVAAVLGVTLDGAMVAAAE